MDSELKELEKELRGFSPSPVSSEVLSRMAEAMDRWEEQETEQQDLMETVADELPAGGKVIAFPAQEMGREKQTSWKPMWAAAAAVVFFGVIVGFLSPRQKASQLTDIEVPPVPEVRQASFVPIDVNRRIHSMDTGVIADRQGVPHQLIRVVREEEASFKQGENVGLKITRPQVNYYVLPVSY